jgi:uncharacterized membrane protein
VTGRFDTARVEAFSDGVFAIAITLLVLEISIPEDEFDDLWAAIADQWPSYLAYVTSFLTIGGLWLVHHGIFRRMRFADPTVLRTNLVLLLMVAFLPFPTRLVAETLTINHAERPAVLFYGAVLFVISALMTTLARYVAVRDEMRGEEISRDEMEGLARLIAPSPGFYVLVLFGAVFAPDVAAFGFLVIAVAAITRRPHS